ncbi:hypothetical protein HHI36_020586 [Cryptolaemus montrouzieri]|uniref:GOST seven transmembrane domain-containing protein n=1 Tax=Cryptolaemus montrouzieri TaxID=559131 RepID=A0ABD2NB68_9CUCU
MMSMLFSITGSFWLYVLLRCKQHVQKIHYMMAVLIFLHAISLALYSVNYHFMKRLGMNSPLWITMFYIMRFLNQMLFFVVLVLLGAGWNITKPVLIMREKVVLITVVILQISANVTKIISHENQQYIMNFLSLERTDISFNLLTFGCTLFPIIWSIKRCWVVCICDNTVYNFERLKMFRHFFVMVALHIYSNYILVDILQMAVPFQYAWLGKMFKEAVTYVLFVFTAYKFRPNFNVKNRNENDTTCIYYIDRDSKS